MVYLVCYTYPRAQCGFVDGRVAMLDRQEVKTFLLPVHTSRASAEAALETLREYAGKDAGWIEEREKEPPSQDRQPAMR